MTIPSHGDISHSIGTLQLVLDNGMHGVTIESNKDSQKLVRRDSNAVARVMRLMKEFFCTLFRIHDYAKENQVHSQKVTQFLEHDWKVIKTALDEGKDLKAHDKTVKAWNQYMASSENCIFYRIGNVIDFDWKKDHRLINAKTDLQKLPDPQQQPANKEGAQKQASATTSASIGQQAPGFDSKPIIVQPRPLEERHPLNAFPNSPESPARHRDRSVSSPDPVSAEASPAISRESSPHNSLEKPLERAVPATDIEREISQYHEEDFSPLDSEEKIKAEQGSRKAALLDRMEGSWFVNKKIVSDKEEREALADSEFRRRFAFFSNKIINIYISDEDFIDPSWLSDYQIQNIKFDKGFPAIRVFDLFFGPRIAENERIRRIRLLTSEQLTHLIGNDMIGLQGVIYLQYCSKKQISGMDFDSFKFNYNHIEHLTPEQFSEQKLKAFKNNAMVLESLRQLFNFKPKRADVEAFCKKFGIDIKQISQASPQPKKAAKTDSEAEGKKAAES